MTVSRSLRRCWMLTVLLGGGSPTDMKEHVEGYPLLKALTELPTVAVGDVYVRTAVGAGPWAVSSSMRSGV